MGQVYIMLQWGFECCFVFWLVRCGAVAAVLLLRKRKGKKRNEFIQIYLQHQGFNQQLLKRTLEEILSRVISSESKQQTAGRKLRMKERSSCGSVCILLFFHFCIFSEYTRVVTSVNPKLTKLCLMFEFPIRQQESLAYDWS